MTAAGEATRGGFQPRVRKSRPGTWTDERIVGAMRDWYVEFGATPLSYEWSPGAARLLGVPQLHTREWIRQYPRWPGTATVCRHFSSWSAAVRAAGLPPARAIAPRRGLAERIEAAQRLSAEGRGSAEIAALLEVSPRTARGYLRAGWCRDCGARVVTSDRCPRCASRRANRSQWTRGQVLDAMRAWACEEGAAPTSGDWTPASDPALKWAREFPRWPSNVTVKTLFGRWRDGVAAAGLQPRRRRWDRTSIRAALQRFATVHGRAPGSADLEQRAELPAPGTVRAHYGSLADALDAAALPVRRRRRANVFAPRRTHAE